MLKLALLSVFYTAIKCFRSLIRNNISKMKKKNENYRNNEARTCLYFERLSFSGVFTEPEHILGHEPLPDVVQFTDEELGIPKE